MNTLKVTPSVRKQIITLFREFYRFGTFNAIGGCSKRQARIYFVAARLWMWFQKPSHRVMGLSIGKQVQQCIQSAPASLFATKI